MQTNLEKETKDFEVKKLEVLKNFDARDADLQKRENALNSSEFRLKENNLSMREEELNSNIFFGL